MPQIINNYIMNIQKYIATLLLIPQLLTSCGPTEIARTVNPQEPLGTTAQTPLEEASSRSINYGFINGVQKTIWVQGIERMTVGDLLSQIKENEKEGMNENYYWNLIVGLVPYDEGDRTLLANILKDVSKIDAGELTVVKIQNYEKARRLVGDENYLGIDAWQKLLSEEELAAIELPPLPEAMVAEIKYLIEDGGKPICMLNLGYSIASMATKMQEKSFNLFSKRHEGRFTFTGVDMLRQHACYNEAIGTPRWCLIPDTEYKMFQEGLFESYNDQVRRMTRDYPNYRVGKAQELVMFVMLKHMQKENPTFATQGDRSYYQTSCCEETNQVHPSTPDSYSHIYLTTSFLKYGRSHGSSGIEIGVMNTAQPRKGLFCVFDEGRYIW